MREVGGCLEWAGVMVVRGQGASTCGSNQHCSNSVFLRLYVLFSASVLLLRDYRAGYFQPAYIRGIDVSVRGAAQAVPKHPAFVDI